MKYIDEFRDPVFAQSLQAAIRAESNPRRQYRFMEFCGGHTHAISRYGLEDLIPDNIRLVHGPGCPVCVLPMGRIDQAIHLALSKDVMLTTYGDTLRVPASNQLSLMQAKAQGADIRMVYSAMDALDLAQKHPERQVVFFAIGFETTTPATALVIKMASTLDLDNFSVLCSHVLTPAAITHIMEEGRRDLGVDLHGFIGPAHVSMIIGSSAYQAFAEQYKTPVVISGFEPLDVLQSIWMLLCQTNQGRHCVENQFTRAVTEKGNHIAQAHMQEVFDLRDTFEWRGLGELAHSALKISERFDRFDAEKRFSLDYQSVPDHKQCECGVILRGLKKPHECKLFATVCTPEHPLGSCMVSSEGACAAHYSYGRFRDQKTQASVSD
jgi:hydrogenase expression/formation protein HypD